MAKTADRKLADGSTITVDIKEIKDDSGAVIRSYAKKPYKAFRKKAGDLKEVEVREFRDGIIQSVLYKDGTGTVALEQRSATDSDVGTATIDWSSANKQDWSVDDWKAYYRSEALSGYGLVKNASRSYLWCDGKKWRGVVAWIGAAATIAVVALGLGAGIPSAQKRRTKAELAASQNTVAEQNADITNLTNDNNNKDRTINSQNNTIEGQKGTIKEQEGTIGEQGKTIEEQKGTIEDLNKEKDQLEGQNQTLQGENESLQDDLSAAQQELENLKNKPFEFTPDESQMKTLADYAKKNGGGGKVREYIDFTYENGKFTFFMKGTTAYGNKDRIVAITFDLDELKNDTDIMTKFATAENAEVLSFIDIENVNISDAQTRQTVNAAVAAAESNYQATLTKKISEQMSSDILEEQKSSVVDPREASQIKYAFVQKLNKDKTYSITAYALTMDAEGKYHVDSIATTKAASVEDGIAAAISDHVAGFGVKYKDVAAQQAQHKDEAEAE